ncbi:hypothetical protein [Methylorubrum sp. DB1722]|uniref:hypothetical protein n=1 Tax=Methylorubrum sp. DB1722 TaxID=2478916 RepID=UPI0018E3527A|nr:hypothetical protein [Methylorubrum sp. DB1722]MBI1689552.1 hypothetical protein [Methylorubrum sp. DB1722]
MALHPVSLELAARLLLGNEFKRPLARLLGPYHPDGARESIDPRLVFRWLAPPRIGSERNPAWRPIPAWVAPVLGKLLAEQAEEFEYKALKAREHSERLLAWKDTGEGEEA